MRIVQWIALLQFFAVTEVCVAQSVEIKSIAFKDNKLVVGYDLLDSMEGRFYSVRIYSSVDGFLNPLTKLNGDVGLEVKPGQNKSVEWAFKEELPEFEGKVSIEVRARIFVPFIGVQGINQYKVFKRKRKYNLTWTGGTSQNVLNFDLYNGDRKVYTFPNLANVGHYTFEFASHLRPGKNYRFRISDTKNKEEVVFSGPFKIKRKIPLLLKIIPAGVVGGAAFFFLQSEKSTPSTDINTGLGDPPLPGFSGN